MHTNKPTHYPKLLALTCALLVLLPILMISLQQPQDLKSHAAGTSLSFTIYLHGIGKGGDSANAGSGGNVTPFYSERTINVVVANSQNQIAATKDLIVTYHSDTGNFVGTADFGALSSGAYTVSVKADRYTRGLVSGIQTLASGQVNQVAPVYLIAGDIDGNNQINILDFNILMGCYSDLAPARDCDAERLKYADLTDDDSVNQLDYNLFIREISNRSGAANPTPIQSVPTAIPTVIGIPTSKPTVVPSPTKAPTAAPTIAATVAPTSGTAQLPAQVFSLANWKETLPTGSAGSPTEIKQPQLATFQLDPWFITAGGGIRFRAAVNGVTTSGSSYPRSELREMTDNGATNASWTTSSGTHTMMLDQAITAVPKTKKHVVAGQIHDSGDDVIVIRLEFPKLFVDIGGSDGPTLDANYTLGKRFTVKFEVTGGKTNIYYNNSTTPAYTMTKSYSGAYFKTGAYTQSNCTTETAALCTADNYGEVIVYKATVTHQ